MAAYNVPGSISVSRVVLLIFMLAVASTPLVAQPEIGSGASLVQACHDEIASNTPAAPGFCQGYLLGYVEAHPEIVFSEQLPSEYMQRVLRTRAPAHPRTDVTKLAVYCLQSVDTLLEISTSIAEIDPDAVWSMSPERVIENILKQGYRCRP